jgi:hypothetical protein
MVRFILGLLSFVVIGVLWLLRLIHVARWDNTPSPYMQQEAEPKPAPTKQQAAAQDNVKTLQVGEAKINKAAEYASYIEEELNDEQADGAWGFTRYDGQHKTPNLTAWSDADEYVIKLKGFTTERTRQNYIDVRPMVLLKATNVKIAEAFGKKISWAETYGGACRLMVRIRLKELNIDENSHSPTEEEAFEC